MFHHSAVELFLEKEFEYIEDSQVQGLEDMRRMNRYGQQFDVCFREFVFHFLNSMISPSVEQDNCLPCVSCLCSFLIEIGLQDRPDLFMKPPFRDETILLVNTEVFSVCTAQHQ
jgi:hypothetical protein